MKKILFLFFFSFVSIFGQSQTYTPFDFINGEWVCGYNTKNGVFVNYPGDYVDEFVKLYCQGDTIINDTTYTKLYYTGYAVPHMSPQVNISGYYGALRNDTVQKRVYSQMKWSIFSGVLYDFNLNVGDVWLNNDTIISIDSIMFCNKYHRRFNYKDCYGGNRYFAEGIGASCGLLPMDCFDVGALICYAEKNNAICDTCKTPVGINEFESSQFNIFPNPAESMITIEIPGNTEKLLFSLFNLNGQIVIQQNLSDGKNNIDISGLSCGVYYARFVNDKTAAVKKIIKE